MNYSCISLCLKDFENLMKVYPYEEILPKKVYQGKFEKIPVWVMWEQGYKIAPEIVKVCINSIKQHIPQDKAEVILLTKENLKDYIELPDYVVQRVSGKRTALSNIIRSALLYNYGGMWIDATMLAVEDIPIEEIAKHDFWAYKEDFYNQDKTDVFKNFTFTFMYSKPGNDMLGYIYSGLCNYWKHYFFLKHYFLKDGVIVYGYRNKKYNTKWIDDLKESCFCMYNFHCNNLDDYYSASKIKERQNAPGEHAIVFKTSYKTNFLKEKINGKQTFWGYFKELYLKGENK
jgi:hypothetical protein